MEIIRNRSVWFWIGLLLTILNISILISLANNVRQMPPKPEANNESQIDMFMGRELGLSPEQTTQFRNLRREFFNNTEKYRRKLGSINQEMLNEMSAENPDRKKLNTLVEEAGKYHQLIKHETVEHFMDLREVCTPEQQQKLSYIYQGMLNPEKYFQPRHRGPGRDFNRNGRGRFREMNDTSFERERMHRNRR